MVAYLKANNLLGNKLSKVLTYTSSTLFIMGVAAAHSASALINSARPIREPTSLSLGLSLRNALEIIQPLNSTVGLPPVPKSFSSNGGSKLNGRALPRLMHLGDLRCSKEVQPAGVESGSSNRLSEGPGSEFGPPWESPGSAAKMFPSLSEMTFNEESDYKNLVWTININFRVLVFEVGSNVKLIWRSPASGNSARQENAGRL